VSLALPSDGKPAGRKPRRCAVSTRAPPVPRTCSARSGLSVGKSAAPSARNPIDLRSGARDRAGRRAAPVRVGCLCRGIPRPRRTLSRSVRGTEGPRFGRVRRCQGERRCRRGSERQDGGYSLQCDHRISFQDRRPRPAARHRNRRRRARLLLEEFAGLVPVSARIPATRMGASHVEGEPLRACSSTRWRSRKSAHPE
jgi:hypothetical protein